MSRNLLSILTMNGKMEASIEANQKDWPLPPKLARLSLRADVLTAESDMIERFKEQSVPFLPTIPRGNIEWLALAQHHGLPTRLLDWTTNPLIALWFVVAAPAKDQKPGALWVFRPEKEDIAANRFNPYIISKTKIFRPPHLISRIRAQSGWFTVHATKDDAFVPLGRNKFYAHKLTRVLIAADKFTSFRHDLDIIGINRAFAIHDLMGWLNI